MVLRNRKKQTACSEEGNLLDTISYNEREHDDDKQDEALVDESYYCVLMVEEFKGSVHQHENFLIFDEQGDEPEWKLKLSWIGEKKPKIYFKRGVFWNPPFDMFYLDIHEPKVWDFLLKKKRFMLVEEKHTKLPNGWNQSMLTVRNIPPTGFIAFYEVGILNSKDEMIPVFWCQISSYDIGNPKLEYLFSQRNYILDCVDCLNSELPRKNILLRHTQFIHDKILHREPFTTQYQFEFDFKKEHVDKVFKRDRYIHNMLDNYFEKVRDEEIQILYPLFLLFGIMDMRHTNDIILLEICEECEIIYSNFLIPNIPRIEEFYLFWKESSKEALQFHIESVVNEIKNIIITRTLTDASVQAFIRELSVISMLYNEPDLFSHIQNISLLLYQWTRFGSK